MFRNKIGKFWLAISVLVSMAVISTPSYALPSFARQTNKACAACHFQNFPMLTDYGRAFKASGFTEIYTEPTRENTDSGELSLPIVLNSAFFGTMRYDRFSGDRTDSAGSPTYANFSEFTLPEEASLFISGRVASNVGFHSEIGLRPSAGLAAIKLPFSFPINDSMRVLVVPFAADGHGPSYGFETLNTGASDIHLTFENGAQTSAQGYLSTADQGASGVAAVLWDPRFYVSYTRWAPTFIGGPAGIGSNYAPGNGIQAGKTPSANYFRAVYFVPIRGWDAAIGFQDFSGSSATPFDATAGALFDGSRVNTVLWVIDAQVQGAIGKYPLGVYFTHGHAPPSGTNQNLFNLSDPVNGIGVHAKTATTITSSFGLFPGKINISAGFMRANNGTDSSITGFPSSDNAFTAGVVYLFSQNVKFLFEFTRLQHGSGHDLDGEFDTNGHPVADVNQKMTFKLFYDL